MLTRRASAPAPAAVHCDLDGARHIYRVHGWQYDYLDDPLFESGLTAALEVFGRRGLRATFFVIAEDVHDPPKRRLLEQAVAEGHEIASHSTSHRVLTRLAAAELMQEIDESRRTLRATLNVEVRGFRAPAFQVNTRCLAAIRDAGYVYDSSRLGGRQAGPHPALPGSALLEVPVPSFPIVPLPFHPSYSLIVGDWYFRQGVAMASRRGTPFILLFHLTDFAEPLPPARLRQWRQRLFTLSHLPARHKRARCAAALDLVTRQFRLGSTSDLTGTSVAAADAPQEVLP